ncbi:hypothetical protein ACB092_01G148100 [Castanea dentata]
MTIPLLCFTSSTTPLLPIIPTTTPFLPSLSKLSHKNHNQLMKKKMSKKLRSCRAEFANDAPFAAAIGACMLTSLLLPVTGGDGTEDSDNNDSVFGLSDTRFSVMGIISFIPYFNWLSWVFAWLDTGKRRYVVYSLVYLAPYIRSNMSLSLEESWLPIASIVFCIVHIQLEASIKNGDIQGFNIFSNAVKQFPSMTSQQDHSKGHEGISEEGRKAENINLPPAEEESRNEIPRWEVPKRPSGDQEHSNEDGYDDEERKH